MESATPPAANPPAGWYPDPNQPGRRFWDGSNWTDQIAPPDQEVPVQAVSSAKPKDPRNNTLATCGYIFAIIMPIIGAILAIPLYSRGDRRATAVLLTSIVAFVIWFLIAISSASTSSSGY
jgi:hypothetical protein